MKRARTECGRAGGCFSVFGEGPFWHVPACLRAGISSRPGGTLDSSPAFQTPGRSEVWVRVPEGQLNLRANDCDVVQPCLRHGARHIELVPPVKLAGYFQRSLREP